MTKYTLIDHTADIGIEIYARTKKELFARAALALAEFLTGVPSGRTSRLQARKIIVEGADTEDLLVNFLREILYLFNAKGLALRDCRIEKGGYKRLDAVLYLEPPAGGKIETKLEIKAVTYHGLSVLRQESGWVARVIFDV